MMTICYYVFLSIFFFFSSRRRHTRSLCDWSSDVCSSDLIGVQHDEAVLDGLDQHGAEHRADHAAAAAEQAGAAEDGGGDHRELLLKAEGRGGHRHLAGRDDAADRRAQAADAIDREDDAPDIDAGLG